MSHAPLDVLRDLADREASGELICVAGEVEVHVFLQRGRVAWATDSEHPRAFARHLQDMTGIDDASFRDILESCQRERRPLGETLVTWGAASHDEVREALRHQLLLALKILARPTQTQSLFLDRTRQYSEYDASLTFAVQSLLETAPAPAAPAAPLARPSARPRAATNDAERLLATVDDLMWTELFTGVELVAAAPEPTPTPRVGRAIIEESLLDGTELVALRDPAGTLAGARMGRNQSLWCRLSAAGVVGRVISELGIFAMLGGRESPTQGAGERGDAWTFGASDSPVAEALAEFVRTAPSTLAALFIDPDEPSASLGVGTELPCELALELTRRRTPLTQPPWSGSAHR